MPFDISSIDVVAPCLHHSHIFHVEPMSLFQAATPTNETVDNFIFASFLSCEDERDSAITRVKRGRSPEEAFLPYRR